MNRLFHMQEGIARRIIIDKLVSCNWNLTVAATELRIPLPIFKRKMKKLKIETHDGI